MATQVLGTRYGGDGVYATDYFYYTASSTETKYTLTLYSGVRFINASGPSVAWGARATTLTGTGQTAKSGSVAAWRQGSNVTTSDKTAVSSFSWSWNKTTSTQTVTITAYTTSPSNHASQKASKSFTIPALKSYTVSFNANGGSGAPSSQTKYYGKALTLSTGKPTRTGYTFKGWATTQARANDGYIDYNSGGTVAADTNSALTLYAVWDLNYVRPKITNISVERCLSDGTQDDEGTYALVTFDWAIDGVKYPSNAVDSLTVQVGTDTSTPTVSGQSGTNLSVIVGSNSFDTDTEYPVTITLSDTSQQTSNTTVVTQTLTVTKFPIDISETGDEMGLMMAARSGQTLTIPRDSYADNINIWDCLYYADTYGAITGGTWSSKSIGTGSTLKELANFTIPEDGVWLLIAQLIYASNATGQRTMTIATSSATSGVGIYTDRRQAVNGAETPLRVVILVQGNTKYYVNTYHGASTALTCQGRYTAFKIGNSVNKIGG